MNDEIRKLIEIGEQRIAELRAAIEAAIPEPLRAAIYFDPLHDYQVNTTVEIRIDEIEPVCFDWRKPNEQWTLNRGPYVSKLSLYTDDDGNYQVDHSGTTATQSIETALALASRTAAERRRLTAEAQRLNQEAQLAREIQQAKSAARNANREIERNHEIPSQPEPTTAEKLIELLGQFIDERLGGAA